MTRIGKKLFEITSVPFKDPQHLPIPKLPEEAPVEAPVKEPAKEPVPVRKA